MKPSTAAAKYVADAKNRFARSGLRIPVVSSGNTSSGYTRMHATVVSRPDARRAVVDAGSKSLSSDLAAAAGPGYGHILDYPDAVIERLSEEHGIVDLSACANKPELGERLRIVPNHVCVVSNLHDAVAVSRDGRVVGNWQVAARGKTR